MKTRNKSLLLFVYSLVGIFTAVAVCFIGFQLQTRALDGKNSAKEERFEVPAGVSVREISTQLEQQHLIRSSRVFYLSVRFPVLLMRSERPVMKSGVYTVSSSMSISEIVRLFESGKQEYIKTVIPEGLTLRKIAQVLENKGVCRADDFIFSATSRENLSKYKIPAENFEGFLFPDTYNFAPGMKADSVLYMMVDNFFSHIQTIPQMSGKSPSEFYEILTLASIVEREYRTASEAPLIASVFTNRISDGAGLYSCATIEYIITEIQMRPHPDVITYADLKIDSPYNTYKWAGLTPGPISNPGMVALSAAANPPKTNYRFFVLKGDGSGSHNFTRTQSEHEKAIVQYRTKKAAGSN